MQDATALAEKEQAKALEMAKGLRALADHIEAKGADLPLPDSINVRCDATVYDNHYQVDEAASKAVVKKAVRSLGRGKKEKIFNEYQFECNKTYGPHVTLKVVALRAAVCRKVLTGNKITHAASTQYLPERIEEEYEWVCDDPILAPTK